MQAPSSDSHLVRRQIITPEGCPTRNRNLTTNWASCQKTMSCTDRMGLMFAAKSFKATCRSALIGRSECLAAWLSPLYLQPRGSVFRAAAPKESLRAQKLSAPSCGCLGYDWAQIPESCVIPTYLEPDSLLLILIVTELVIFSGKKS